MLVTQHGDSCYATLPLWSREPLLVLSVHAFELSQCVYLHSPLEPTAQEEIIPYWCQFVRIYTYIPQCVFDDYCR